jgi:glycine hydroxymethyltransferase
MDGWSVSATGKWFNSVQYGVRKDTAEETLAELSVPGCMMRP